MAAYSGIVTGHLRLWTIESQSKPQLEPDVKVGVRNHNSRQKYIMANHTEGEKDRTETLDVRLTQFDNRFSKLEEALQKVLSAQSKDDEGQSSKGRKRKLDEDEQSRDEVESEDQPRKRNSSKKAKIEEINSESDGEIQDEMKLTPKTRRLMMTY